MVAEQKTKLLLKSIFNNILKNNQLQKTDVAHTQKLNLQRNTSFHSDLFFTVGKRNANYDMLKQLFSGYYHTSFFFNFILKNSAIYVYNFIILHIPTTIKIINSL